MAFADLPPGRHAEQVRNHWWWRPGWRSGRQGFTWHIIFDGTDGLHALAAEYQQALIGLMGIRFVPLQWLHLTMQGIGFTDEVSSSDLDRILDEARGILTNEGPLTLTFQKAFVADEAIVLPPLEEESVIELRKRLRQAIGSVWGSENVPEAADKFRPHVSFAYFEEDSSASPYVAAIEAISPKAIQVEVREASLIKINRDHGMYEWTKSATAPLSRA